MLLPRIIPVLLHTKEGLIKTENFSNPKYIGDPLNAVRIFNEKKVDELIFLDIEASKLKREPHYELIKKIASECNMPLTYGGGINSVSQIENIIKLGVEKISINSSAISTPELITQAADRFGRQSIVVTIDIKLSGLFRKSYKIFDHKTKTTSNIELLTHLKKIQELGAGEIVINSFDKDGTMLGYDYNLIDYIKPSIKVPLTALGGASKLSDMTNLFKKYGLIGAAAGSIFVFKGKYRAVLIQYPSNKEKKLLYSLPYFIS
ncbi:imidazole glycerol phosphate synthase subunit HisF [bacterium]|nr:imidazole glycerol phosphate synthase subunit HisF [bacterium]